ncbi:MAG: hypothetical protein ABIY47_08220 [Opitutaceae bacterium]
MIVRQASMLAILAALVAPAVQLSAQRADTPAFSVPPLVQQMEIRSIARWGDDIIVETDFWGLGYRTEIASPPRFWRLDSVARTFTRFDPGGGRRYLGFSTGEGSRLAVSLRGKEVELLALDPSVAAPRLLCSLGEIPAPIRFHLATLGRFHVAIGGGTVVIIEDGKVARRIPLAEVVAPDRAEPPRFLEFLLGSVRAVAATNREIFVGLSAGEFGGGAFAFSLTDDGHLRNPHKVWSQHVSAVAVQDDGAVWMAGGHHDGVGTGGSLVRELRGQLEVLVHQASMMDRERPVSPRPILRLPRASSLDGLALDGRDNVIVAATEVGLVGLKASGEMKILWDHSLLPAPVDARFAFRGQPVGLLLHGDRLFLATRFLGLLEFVRQADGFQFRGQITIRNDQ